MPKAGMVFLAQQTGGFALLNHNNLDFGVRKALEDNETYYLLGFDPEDEQFNGRYHSIKVRVKRPGLQARTRGGFYGVTEAEASARPRTPTQQILSTLYSPFGARDVQVQMTSFAFNEEGQVVDQYASRLTFDLDEAQYQEAMAKGLVRAADVPIKKPGAYQFHAVLRDAVTGRLKLTGFPPGDYLLRLIVTDALARQKYARIPISTLFLLPP